MVVPKNTNIRKAERIGQEHRQTEPQSGEIGTCGHFHVQHHNGDDDGDHSIRERLEPLLTHRCPLSFTLWTLSGPLAAKPVPAKAISGLHKPDSWSSGWESVPQAAGRHQARLTHHERRPRSSKCDRSRQRLRVGDLADAPARWKNIPAKNNVATSEGLGCINYRRIFSKRTCRMDKFRGLRATGHRSCDDRE